MEPLTRPNEGDRPSALELDRAITGELTGPEASRASAWLEEAGADHRQATEAARRALPPLDITQVRHRASNAAEAHTVPPPANPTWVQWFGVVGMAAALLLTALPSAPTLTEPGSGFTTKGSALSVYSLESDQLTPYDGRALGAGDVVGFKVSPGSHSTLTLLSVDGTGAVTVFFPEHGRDPLSVGGRSSLELPGTVTLDGAPGPELFVAVWDSSVETAQRSLAAAYAAGGAEGVERWSQSTGGVDLVKVARR